MLGPSQTLSQKGKAWVNYRTFSQIHHARHGFRLAVKPIRLHQDPDELVQ